MTAIATIIRPGAETTVQDAGRSDFRYLGVPQSGAADRLSFALANAAAGNPWDAPALECAATGPEMRFEAPAAFALGGADMSAKLNDMTVSAYAAQSAKEGDVLNLGPARNGLRAYIAIAGGVAAKIDFGSAATYAPAGLGGIDGRALAAGDAIERTDAPASQFIETPTSATPTISGDVFLRVVAAPEFHLIDADAQKKFHSEAFTASRRANRMGVELNGASIHPPEDFSMLSSPVFPGTVQCPPSGNPFLLLADAQTVGGYARIAQVIGPDLHLAGQIRPGAKVWFKGVSPEEARDIAAQQTAFYSAYLRGFRFG